MRWIAPWLLCGLPAPGTINAQGADPNLVREVAAVADAVARSKADLRQYTWTESTEVFVKGSLQSTTELVCRYDDSGRLTKTPAGKAKEENANSVSKRPLVRSKADMQDYIQRSINRVQAYVPLEPQQIGFLLQNGMVFLQPGSAQTVLRFEHYFEEGDSVVLTYDSVSKSLLHASITSTLGNPKDPVTMEAGFETAPLGVNHLASAILNAKRRNVEVKVRNGMYQKVD